MILHLPLFFWIGEGILALMMIRNRLVRQERQRVNDEMHRLGQEDITQGYSPFWRYDHFFAVSYERMLFTPRRLRSFYRDSPALKPLSELDWKPARLPVAPRETNCTLTQTAIDRANELLDQHLTPKQRMTVKLGYLQIQGKSGRRYCIHWRTDNSYFSPDVYLLRRQRGRYGHHRLVCCSVAAYQTWPSADKVLALKLCLESDDEKRVMKAAVKSRTPWTVHP